MPRWCSRSWTCLLAIAREIPSNFAAVVKLFTSTTRVKTVMLAKRSMRYPIARNKLSERLEINFLPGTSKFSLFTPDAHPNNCRADQNAQVAQATYDQG